MYSLPEPMVWSALPAVRSWFSVVTPEVETLKGPTCAPALERSCSASACVCLLAACCLSTVLPGVGVRWGIWEVGREWDRTGDGTDGGLHSRSSRVNH